MKDLGKSFPESEREIKAKKSRLNMCRWFLLENLQPFNRHIESGYYEEAESLGYKLVNKVIEAKKLTEEIRQMQLDLDGLADSQPELTLSASAEPKRSNGNPPEAQKASGGAISGGVFWL